MSRSELAADTLLLCAYSHRGTSNDIISQSIPKDITETIYRATGRFEMGSNEVCLHTKNPLQIQTDSAYFGTKTPLLIVNRIQPNSTHRVCINKDTGVIIVDDLLNLRAPNCPKASSASR
jgi:hypothetical protein